MAKLIGIEESVDRFVAEGLAYVWEEYDAPRKRTKRVRPVEHRFTVEVPKVDAEDAPVAFVVEHFPSMSLNWKMLSNGYDQQIRAHGGRFYTPARFIDHRRYCGTYKDIRTELGRAVEGVSSIPDYLLEELTACAAEDGIRADKWHSYGHATAAWADSEAANAIDAIVVGGELYMPCHEPVYVYSSPTWYGNRKGPGYIYVDFGNCGGEIPHNAIGALDRIEMALYFDGTARTAYIDVKRPDLVSVKSTERDIEERRRRAENAVDELAERIAKEEKALGELRRKLDEKRAELEKSEQGLEAWHRDETEYWRSRLGKLGNSKWASIARKARAAARVIGSAEEA